MTKIETVLTDFVTMAENEIHRIKTGHAPGPSMRDSIGQWESTVREAKQILAERKARHERWLNNPDGPQAA